MMPSPRWKSSRSSAPGVLPAPRVQAVPAIDLMGASELSGYGPLRESDAARRDALLPAGRGLRRKARPEYAALPVAGISSHRDPRTSLLKCNGITEAFSAERHCFQSQLRSRSTEQSRGSLLQQSFTGRAHQPERFAQDRKQITEYPLLRSRCSRAWPRSPRCDARQQVGQHVDFEGTSPRAASGTAMRARKEDVLFPQSAAPHWPGSATGE